MRRAVAGATRMASALSGLRRVVGISADAGLGKSRLVAEIVRKLRERDIFLDARTDRLRFGPAPYLTDEEIDAGVAAFREVCPPS